MEVNVDRSSSLAAKARELTEYLQEWAKAVLSPGEQVLVSLRIVEVAVVAVDPEDESTAKYELLETRVLDFFTLDRLKSNPSLSGLAGRTRNCLGNERHLIKDITLRTFIKEYDEYTLLRIPNFGRNCLNLIKLVLSQEGLQLRRSRNS